MYMYGLKALHVYMHIIYRYTAMHVHVHVRVLLFILSVNLQLDQCFGNARSIFALIYIISNIFSADRDNTIDYV